MAARPGVDLDGPPARVAQPWLDVTAQIAEGPLWDDRSGELAWVDLEVGHVHWASPTGGPGISIALGQAVGAVLPRQSGGWVLPLEEGVATLDSPTSKPRVMARVEPPTGAHVRFNDAKCDPCGRLWVGTMAWDASPGRGALYRVDADWSVTTVLTGLTLSNGMAWNRSADTMYFIDSRAAAVWAFDFDATTGGLGERREHIAIAPGVGEPDGMTIDAEGCLWVAIYGGGEVRRYLPTGELDGIVEVPTPLVTSCTFGDDDLGELYITTAGGRSDRSDGGGGQVFRFRPGVTGTRADRFAG
jgi:sugar lactone lactonase YvrE